MPSNFQKRIEKSVCLIFYFCVSVYLVKAQPAYLQPELSTNRGLKNDFVRIIRQDADGRTWIGTDAGLQILNADNRILQELINSLKNDAVLSIGFLKNFALIGTTASGLKIIDLQSGKIYKSISTDTIGYVRKIRILGDTAFVAANQHAGYITLGSIGPTWHPFLWHHQSNVYIIDFYRRNGVIYGIDHSSDNIIPSFFIKRADSLIKTAYPESIPPPAIFMYLTAETNEGELKIAGDGFYSSLSSVGQKQFINLKGTADSLKMAVWDMAQIGSRQFLALGQPYRMKIGAAYEVGVSSSADIRKDFYCQSLLYDSKNDALWMGTANRGLFLWPNISTTKTVPLSISGKVKVIAMEHGQKVIYNDNEVYHIFNDKQTPILISMGEKGKKYDEIFEVKYWKDTIAVLRVSSFSLYDVNGKKLFQKELTAYAYNHFNLMQDKIVFFSIYDQGIAILKRGTSDITKIEGLSIESRSMPYDRGLIYFCEEEGFYFLDNRVRSLSPAITKAQDYVIYGDTLWILDGGKINRYLIELKTSRLKLFNEKAMDQLIPNFQLNWMRKLESGLLVAGNAKGFVALDRKTLNPLWYRYTGNFSEGEGPVVNLDSLIYQQENWLSTVPGLQPFSIMDVRKIKVDFKSGFNFDENTSLTINFSHPDYFIENHCLKKLEITFPDGHQEQYYTLDSSLQLPRGLKQGNYNVELDVNGISVGTWKWKAQIPILRNPMLYASITAILGLLFYLFFKFRNRQKDLERMMLETRMKLLKKNLDPHFIFNSLNLTYMLLMQGKYEEATQSILKFSDLHRYFLEMINLKEVPLSEELKFVANYLNLENGRLDAENGFEYSLPHENELLHKIMIPPMILQPLVENAVKYCGFGDQKGTTKRIIVSCIASDGKATVSIENSVSSSAMDFSHRLGKGISIVQQIIEIYNKNHHGNIVFRPSTTALVIENGYRCELEITI